MLPAVLPGAEECLNLRITYVAERISFHSPFDNRTDIIWQNSHPEEPIPEAELFLWDYFPNCKLQQLIEERPAAQHLVLIEPKWLESLGDLPGCACVLLKPANAFTVRAFIELAFKSWTTYRQAQEAETLRVDRDALLQYVLEVNLKLQQYDQERSNFLARALHDFRAPLTALYGYCGLLAEGKLGLVSAPQQQLLNQMSYSTRRLARLAGGTLELLAQGRLSRSSRFREGDIQQTLDQALHDVYPLIKDKQLTVRADLAPAEGLLHYEHEQIQQVLVNLLENSCKFTPYLGTITICGYNAGPDLPGEQGYRVDVTDSGPGIPAELTDKIFDEYASYAGSEDHSGGGLGLAICKSIITAHRGKIWARPSDRGGCFSFVLPYSLLTDRRAKANVAPGTLKSQCMECR